MLKIPSSMFVRALKRPSSICKSILDRGLLIHTQIIPGHDTISKYFYVQDESKNAESSHALSPAILESMVDEALIKGDQETTKMLLPQTLQLGRPGVRLIEKVIRTYIDQKQFSLAVTVLERCDPFKIVLSQSLCNDLAVGAVNFLRWHEAFVTTLYMMTHDMKFSDRIIYFTVAGLMNDADGLFKVLDLMSVIIEKRREDLGNMLHFGKISEFSQSIGGNRKPVQRYQLEIALKKVMDIWVREASNGFRSFPLAKMIVAIACVGKVEALAATFISQTMKIVSEKETCGYDLDDKDALSLVRALSQGNGLVLHSKKSDKFQTLGKEVSLVTYALLESSVKYCNSAADGSLGIMKCLDFYCNFWILAYRLRGLNSSVCHTLPIKQFEYNDDIRPLYEKLAYFLSEDGRSHCDFRLTSRADRRNMRLLCDKLGVKHKILDKSDGHLWLTVSKQGMSLHDIPQYNDILRDTSDSNCGLDSHPLFWKEWSKLLYQVDEATLSIVVLKLAATMKRQHPVPSWILLFADILIDRDIPLPQGFLRNSLKMCGGRSDIYGLVELLHLSFYEKIRSNTRSYQSSCARISALKYRSILPIVYSELSGSEEDRFVAADILSSNDWNHACYLAYLSRPHFMHTRSFQEVFMEIMALRRKDNIELDQFSSELLMKFLTQNMINKDLLKGLLARVNATCVLSAKDIKLARPSYVECVAASKWLLSHGDGSKLIQLSLPMFKNEHYLQIIPANIEKIADNFISFWILDDGALSKFEQAWARQHNSLGRNELRDILSSLVVTEYSLDEEPVSGSRQWHALAEMAIFVSFLLSAYDKDSKSAFTLLFSVIQYLSRSNDSTNVRKT